MAVLFRLTVITMSMVILAVGYINTKLIK